MKAKYLFVFVMLLGVGLYATNNKWLVGKWELIEFRIIQKYNDATSDEKTLRGAGAVWDMSFSEDGSFRQDFNLRTPDMKMETETGKWITKNDSLFIDLKVDTLTNRLNYTYVVLGDVIVLTLENPMTKDKVISKFRRK